MPGGYPIPTIAATRKIRKLKCFLSRSAHVRTLMDKAKVDRPERRTALVGLTLLHLAKLTLQRKDN